MYRKALTASLLALLCAFSATGAQGQCVPSSSFSASIGLIDQPFPYADLRPLLTQAEIDDLPNLPDPTDEIPRREHAYISTALAEDLGFAPHDSSGNLNVDPDWRQPNPQIRVRLTSPATISNWKSGTTYRDRASNAVFTVVGVTEDARKIVWVYGGLDGTDVETDSGQYKLFAEDTVVAGDREPGIDVYADANGDDLLDTVAANVYCAPVSRSTFTTTTITNTNHYTENDANGSFRETAVRKNDNRFALIVPHGGAIEVKTSDQIAPFVTTLEGTTYNIPVNLWKAEGQWSDDQTSKRWHITTTNTSEQSFPALAWMLDQTWFDATHPFRRTLAFHGMTADEADIIVGGGTDLNAKCHVATKIKAETGMGPVAVRIYHDDQIIDVLASDSHRVCRKGLDGDSDRNIINRLAADGGIQIEQSGDVRNSTTYRDGVANGAAKAIGELLNGTAPANACSVYATPVDEDLVPNC
jgi:phage replication-related protein YjqB (UPF0714/DUF867 family)